MISTQLPIKFTLFIRYPLRKPLAHRTNPLDLITAVHLRHNLFFQRRRHNFLFARGADDVIVQRFLAAVWDVLCPGVVDGHKEYSKLELSQIFLKLESSKQLNRHKDRNPNASSTRSLSAGVAVPRWILPNRQPILLFMCSRILLRIIDIKTAPSQP